MRRLHGWREIAPRGHRADSGAEIISANRSPKGIDVSIRQALNVATALWGAAASTGAPIEAHGQQAPVPAPTAAHRW